MSNIKKKEPITIPEVKSLLEKIVHGESDYIQKRTLEYVIKFSKVDEEKAKNIKKRLMEEGKLSEEEAIELINIMPKTILEVRTFLSGWKKFLTTEEIENLLKILKEEM
ncbi:MAG: RNA polymerase Rpb4 [Nitrososphaerales archaeon]